METVDYSLFRTPEEHKSYLLCNFPEHKKTLGRLTLDQKMEWYSTRTAESMVFLGNDAEFQRFWKFHVLFPMKLKRFYYRLKNFEVFKKYEHISEMRPKVKKYSI